MAQALAPARAIHLRPMVVQIPQKQANRCLPQRCRL